MRILFLVNELLTVCGVTKHFFHLITGLQTRYPENNYFIICGGGDAVQKFNDLNCQVYLNENIEHETRSIQGYLKAVRTVRKFVKENKIDIVHSHHHYAASIASKAGRFTNVKTILTNHGLLPNVGKLSHFNAGHIITVNEHIKDHLIQNDIKKEEEISLIRYGLPMSKKVQKQKGKIKVIAGGRFVKEKGFDLYIKAISKLPKKVRKEAEFYIAGGGEEENSLKKLNKVLDTEVEFLGKINDFQSKLKETHVFVMPSYSKAEGFPTVLIEAGFSENLVIVSNFLGLSDMVSGEHALIFEIGDIGLLSGYLEKSILDYHIYDSKRFTMKKLVETYFNQDKMVEKTYKVYQDILIGP